MTIVIEAKTLQKSFGDLKVIKDGSFSVKEKKIYGLLGANGQEKQPY